MIKLIECTINNYGCFSNESYKFNDLSAILKNNGEGKTTLKNFIIDMLYSEFNTSFSPLNGSAISGSLTVNINDKIYKINGDSSRKRKGSFKIYDEHNNELNISSIGNDILEIDYDSFIRVFNISNLLDSDLQITNLGNNKNQTKIVSNITSLIGEATGNSNTGETINELSTKVKKILKQKDEIFKQGVQLNNEISSLPDIDSQIQQAKKKKISIENEIKHANNELGTIQKNSGIVNEFSSKNNDLNNLINEKNDIYKKYNNNLITTEELDRIKELQSIINNKPKSNNTHTIKIICIFISIILMLTAILLSIITKNYIYLLIFVPSFISDYFILKRTKETISDEENELNNIKSKYQYDINSYEIQKDLNKVHDLTIAIDLKRNELLKYQEDNNQILNCRVTPNEIQSKLNGLNRENEELIKTITNLEAAYNTISAKQSELDQLSEEYNKVEKEYNYYNKMYELLIKSNNDLKEKYSTPIQDNFKKYVELFKNTAINKLSNITIDKEFNIAFENNGLVSDFDKLSDGEKSIIQLISKLAIADSISNGNNNFIILDDPFVYLDEKGINSVTTVLKNLSKEKQVIYLTCHESRMIR